MWTCSFDNEHLSLEVDTIMWNTIEFINQDENTNNF